MTKFFVIIGLALFIAACDGPVGPEGPSGPQGEQGPQGPQGPAGEDGNANVMYSDWLTIANFPEGSTTRDTVIDGSNMRIAHWQTAANSHPTMTEAILDEGVVLVYMRFSNSIYLLPYTSHAGGTPNTLDFFTKDTTKLFIKRFGHNNSSIPISSTTVEFRYVLVPGNVPGGGLRAGLRAELDTSDYEAVRAFYGIPDEGAGEVPAGGAW